MTTISGADLARLRPYLFVAHPGHELLLYGWLELCRPRVFVLTDGSGRSGQSRLAGTEKVLLSSDAEKGTIFGRFTDAELYASILHRDVDVFVALAEELARSMAEKHVGYVVADAVEGFNPVHDLCKLIVGAAIEIVYRLSRIRIVQYEYAVVGTFPCTSADSVLIRLDDGALARKLEMARAYESIRAEVETALESQGAESFRRESLRAVLHWNWSETFLKPPQYEQIGGLRVAAGVYHKVIRYREHMLPIVEKLRRYVYGVSQ